MSKLKIKIDFEIKGTITIEIPEKHEVSLVNSKLKEAIKEILQLNKSCLGGNQFDSTVYNVLYDNLKSLGFRKVSGEEFAEYYKEYRTRSKKLDFNFKGLKPDNITIQSDNLIVSQPNSSSAFPDILVIHNGVGFPIEIKSNKKDRVEWNCTLPKKDTVYIFGCYEQGKTTAFMSKDVIKPEEEKLLTTLRDMITSFKDNKVDEFENWYFYARPQFVSSFKFFKDLKEKEKREKRVLYFAENFKW